MLPKVVRAVSHKVASYSDIDIDDEYSSNNCCLPSCVRSCSETDVVSLSELEAANSKITKQPIYVDAKPTIKNKSKFIMKMF